jgi:hypothetical protein
MKLEDLTLDRLISSQIASCAPPERFAGVGQFGRLASLAAFSIASVVPLPRRIRLVDTSQPSP